MQEYAKPKRYYDKCSSLFFKYQFKDYNYFVIFYANLLNHSFRLFYQPSVTFALYLV